MTNENSPLMEARVHGYCNGADVGCRNIQQQQVACMRTLLSKNHLDGYMNHRMLGRMNRICPKNIFTNPTLTAAIYDSRNMTHDLTIENCPISKLSHAKNGRSQNCQIPKLSNHKNVPSQSFPTSILDQPKTFPSKN